jgi:hypothetical protein
LGLIPTRALTLKDRTVPVPDPARRRIAFTADTRLAAFANRVLPPAPGGAKDPRLGGATLTVYNSNPAPGSPTDTVTVALAPANWKAIGSGSISGYRYTGPDPNGPVKAIVLKNDFLSIKGGKANWSYTLDEPAQGRVAVRLTLSDGSGWCADAPAKRTGNPPSSANTDKQDKFIAQPSTPPPASCPALP